MARAPTSTHLLAAFAGTWPSSHTVVKVLRATLLVALLALLWAAGAWFAHQLAQSIHVDGNGFVEAMPLNALASFMAISWMPLFLPFIIPLAATAWVVVWAIAAISRLGDPD